MYIELHRHVHIVKLAVTAIYMSSGSCSNQLPFFVLPNFYSYFYNPTRKHKKCFLFLKYYIYETI